MKMAGFVAPVTPRRHPRPAVGRGDGVQNARCVPSSFQLHRGSGPLQKLTTSAVRRIASRPALRIRPRTEVEQVRYGHDAAADQLPPELVGGGGGTRGKRDLVLRSSGLVAGREEHVARGRRAARCDGSRSEREGGDDYCRSEQSAMANAAAPRRPPIFSAVPGRRRQRRRRMPVTAYPFLQPCMHHWMHLVQATSRAQRRRRTPRHTPAGVSPLCGSSSGLPVRPHEAHNIAARGAIGREAPLYDCWRREDANRTPPATFLHEPALQPPDPAVGWSPSDASVMRPGTPCGDGTAETGDWRGTAPVRDCLDAVKAVTGA